MFVFLSKTLPLLVYPVGLVSILLLAALMIRRPRLGRALLAAALILIFVSGNRWVSTSLARSLEWQYLPPAETPHAAAIVVLGGATEPGAYPRSAAELNGAGDRVLHAVRLYKQGKAEHILLSGGYITWLEARSSTPAEEMAEIMELMGVPREALWLQTRSQNTYEDALYSAEMLRQNNIDRVLLVTSAMHMPRSVALFEKQGIQVVPLPTDYGVTQAGWDDLFTLDHPSKLFDLIPSVGAISQTSNVMKEYIGMLMYRWKGWI